MRSGLKIVDIGVEIGDGSEWPFIKWLQETAGEIQFVMLIAVGVLLTIGIVGWIAGRVSQSQRVQSVSATIIPIALIGAMVIGGAFALIGWAAGFDIGFGG